MKVKTKIRLNKRKLEKLIDNVPERTEALVRKSAFDITRDASMLAPVLTGALRASIHTIFPKAFYAIVTDGVEYGYTREFGIRGPTQPFMVPAVSKNKTMFNLAIRNLLNV